MSQFTSIIVLDQIPDKRHVIEYDHSTEYMLQ